MSAAITELRDAAREAGVPVREIADILGVTEVSIYGWVQGRRTPSVLHEAVALGLARALRALVASGQLPVDGVGRYASDLAISKLERALQAGGFYDWIVRG